MSKIVPSWTINRPSEKKYKIPVKFAKNNNSIFLIATRSNIGLNLILFQLQNKRYATGEYLLIKKISIVHVTVLL